MEGDWTQAIVMLAAIFGVFLWLRNDIKDNRKEMDKLRDDMKADSQQLRTDVQSDMQQLRSDMRSDMQQLRSDVQSDMQQLRSDIQGDLRRIESKVDGLDGRLRAVESEQSRIAGLLEGMGLAGVLPRDED